MRCPTLLGLLPAALGAAAPAAAASLACDLGASEGGPRIEARLEGEGEAWRLSVLGESFPANPVALEGADAAHFMLAPVDEMAEAVALFSVFGNGTALLTIHGDFLGPAALTRSGHCSWESD